MQRDRGQSAFCVRDATQPSFARYHAGIVRTGRWPMPSPAEGFRIVTGGTDNYLMSLVSPRYRGNAHHSQRQTHAPLALPVGGAGSSAQVPAPTPFPEVRQSTPQEADARRTTPEVV